jgi:hypothetical protein
MIFQKTKNNKGFVLLFAVTLAAIMLSIALGVANIAQKEIKFGTSAKDTNNAFAAADTGIECALLYDKSSTATNAFTGGAPMSCAGSAITVTGSGTPTNFWTFVVSGLGNSGQSCAKVTVDKTLSPKTTIIAKGYNIGNVACDSANPNRIERQLQVSYSTGTLTNVALASNGAVASASSSHSSGNYPASSAINGDRKGTGWGSGTGGWNDNTSGGFPDWLEVDFSGSKNISEIDVYTLQDGLANNDPTPTMTFTQYGIVDFQVQYWDGSAWQTIPNGSVTGNNLVWKHFTFSPITTDKIRVNVTNALQSFSRIVELEAY